jgi:hypothetical protein
MAMKTVHDLWESYKKACYGDRKLSSVQAEETKQAFFAGATALASLFAETSDDDDEAEEQLRKLHAEIRRFGEAQKRRNFQRQARRN